MAGTYSLELQIFGVYTTDIPTLEIWEDGVLDSSHPALLTGSTISVTINYGGALPTSLEFRFNDGLAEGGRTIEVRSIRINDQYVNTGNYLSIDSLTNGGAAGVVDIATADFLAAPADPTGADFAGATALTAGADYYNRSFDGSNQILDGLAGNDGIVGGAGDDRIDGGAGDDRIIGGAGADFIFGNDDNDTIFGNADNDTIFGGDGNDRLLGGSGADEIHGGADDDIIRGGSGNDTLTGGTGVDNLGGGGGDDIMYGGAGQDFLSGSSGDDTLDGGGDEDTLIGGGGNDFLDGGDANDILGGNQGEDVLNGGDGDDQLFGGSDNDILIGGEDAGNDTLYGEGGDDNLDGGQGSDVLVGGSGADTLDGGDGDDFLHGHGLTTSEIAQILRANPTVTYNYQTNSFYEYFTGGASTTQALAQTAATTTLLSGTAGHLVNVTSAAENTYIQSIISGDSWIGSSDEDTENTWIWRNGAEEGVYFYNQATSTTIDGLYTNWSAGEPNDFGAGEDYTQFLSGSAQWNDNGGPASPGSTLDYVIEWDAGLINDDDAVDTINGGAGNDHIYGYGGDDVLSGGDDNDLIIGGAGADTINGDAGNDSLYGGDGIDTINGNAGDDIINAGAGNDIIYANEDTGLYDADWSHRQLITIDSTMVDSDLTNFTVLITEAGLGTDFWTNVKADGSDILFTLGDGVTVLDREVVSIDTVGETLEVHVRIPNLSSTVDTDIALHYGNAGVTLTNDATTWEENYTGVWHLDDVSGTAVEDSSRSQLDGTVRGGLAAGDLVTAQVGSGLDFNGSSDYISLQHSYNSSTSLSGLTVSAWINTTFSGGAYNDNWSILDFDRSEFFNVFVSADTGQLSFSTAAPGIDDFAAGPAINDGAWHYITAVYDGTDKILYVDGAEIGRKVNAHGGAAITDATTRFGFIGDGSEAGSENAGRNNIYYDGEIDDVRLYEGVLSADQIAAEYDNQNTPGSFYSVGAVETHSIVEVDDNDIIAGGDGDDTLYASSGNDTLIGGDGFDTLYGGSGVNTFVLQDVLAYNDVDEIINFRTSEGDILDISDLISGAFSGTITEYIRFDDSGVNTLIQIDGDGTAGGSVFVTAGQINNITGLDEVTLFTDGNIVV